eukprot:Sspe_Gene.56894::Locus_31260_Transcript_1_6_Confidence_0.286_Length_2977::g.56894::m.56894
MALPDHERWLQEAAAAGTLFPPCGEWEGSSRSLSAISYPISHNSAIGDWHRVTQLARDATIDAIESVTPRRRRGSISPCPSPLPRRSRQSSPRSSDTRSPRPVDRRDSLPGKSPSPAPGVVVWDDTTPPPSTTADGIECYSYAASPMTGGFRGMSGVTFPPSLEQVQSVARRRDHLTKERPSTVVERAAAMTTRYPVQRKDRSQQRLGADGFAPRRSESGAALQSTVRRGVSPLRYTPRKEAVQRRFRGSGRDSPVRQPHRDIGSFGSPHASRQSVPRESPRSSRHSPEETSRPRVPRGVLVWEEEVPLTPPNPPAGVPINPVGHHLGTPPRRRTDACPTPPIISRPRRRHDAAMLLMAGSSASKRDDREQGDEEDEEEERRPVPRRAPSPIPLAAVPPPLPPVASCPPTPYSSSLRSTSITVTTLPEERLPFTPAVKVRAARGWTVVLSKHLAREGAGAAEANEVVVAKVGPFRWFSLGRRGKGASSFNPLSFDPQRMFSLRKRLGHAFLAALHRAPNRDDADFPGIPAVTLLPSSPMHRAGEIVTLNAQTIDMICEQEHNAGLSPDPYLTEVACVTHGPPAVEIYGSEEFAIPSAELMRLARRGARNRIYLANGVNPQFLQGLIRVVSRQELRGLAYLWRHVPLAMLGDVGKHDEIKESLLQVIQHSRTAAKHLEGVLGLFSKHKRRGPVATSESLSEGWCDIYTHRTHEECALKAVLLLGRTSLDHVTAYLRTAGSAETQHHTLSDLTVGGCFVHEAYMFTGNRNQLAPRGNPVTLLFTPAADFTRPCPYQSPQEIIRSIYIAVFSAAQRCGVRYLSMQPIGVGELVGTAPELRGVYRETVRGLLQERDWGLSTVYLHVGDGDDDGDYGDSPLCTVAIHREDPKLLAATLAATQRDVGLLVPCEASHLVLGSIGGMWERGRVGDYSFEEDVVCTSTACILTVPEVWAGAVTVETVL